MEHKAKKYGNLRVFLPIIIMCGYTPPGVCYHIIMKKGACHHDKLVGLRRIEGQVRGVQKMIEEGRYCVDILNAMEAVVGALKRIENEILRGHLNACVRTAFRGSSERDIDEKIDEVCALFGKMRKR